MMRTSDLGLSGCNNVLWNCSKESPQIQETPVFGPSQASGFSRLPTELVLNVCERLSGHDLWNNARPASRLLAACAKDIAPRKVFQENTIHVSWCCFWCSLGGQTLTTACKPITSLLPDEKRLRIPVISDYTLIATLIFGDLCNLTAGRDPQIRIRLDEDEEGVTVGTDELQRQLRRRGSYAVQDLQSHQRDFLVWYYAKRRKERARGRITAALANTMHTLRFLAASAVLLIVGMAIALIFCVAMYTFRLLRNVYRRISNLVRFCVGKEPVSYY